MYLIKCLGGLIIRVLTSLLLLLNLALYAQNSDSKTQRFIVRYNKKATPLAKNEIVNLLKGRSIKKDTNFEIQVLEISSQSLDELGLDNVSNIELWASENDAIDHIERDHQISALGPPNDPAFPEQWGLNQNRKGHIHALKAWKLLESNESAVVGFLDSGIDWTHPDLVNNIWQNLGEDADGDGRVLEYHDGAWIFDPGDVNGIDDDGNGYPDDFVGWDFINGDNDPYDDSESGHGTHVAGIAGAELDNGLGISGMSPSIQLMALKFLDENNNGYVSGAIEAIQYARRMNVKILNNSWGGSVYSQFLYELIEASQEEDMLFVAAAGNTGTSLSQTPIYPAAYSLENIISVAATDPKNKLASFSNYDPVRVDIGAPGQDIYSTLPAGQYGMKNGTSMAAPFVSGALAALASTGKEWDAHVYKNILLNNVDLLKSLSLKCQSGGRLNLYKMLLSQVEYCDAWEQITQEYVVKDLLEKGSFLWAATQKGLLRIDRNTCKLERFDVRNTSLPSNSLLSLIFDSEGDMWIGTQNHGLVHFDGENWTTYDMLNSDLPDNRVFDILEDNKGRIWLGTRNGLVRIKNNKWDVYQASNSKLPHNKVKSIERDAEGRVWVGTQAGLLRIENNRWKVFTKNNSGLPANNIKAIALEKDKILWLGTPKGIVRVKNNNWKVYKSNSFRSGFEENGTVTSQTPGEMNAFFTDIRDMKVDGQGQVWVATKRGLLCLDKKGKGEWRLFHPGNSELPDPWVNALWVDYAQHIWSGTLKGLAFFRPVQSVSFEGEEVLCEKESARFENTSPEDLKFEWQINGQRVSTNRDLSHTFRTPGMYTIHLIAQNAFSKDTVSRSVVVQALPQLELGSNVVACADAWMLDAGSQFVEYTWRDTQGNVLGEQSRLSVTENGTYIVQTEDKCGNVYTDRIKVKLSSGCVWPGDVNVDGTVNMLDLYALGKAFGAEGEARPEPSAAYEAQKASADWRTAFGDEFEIAPGINHKHADCNGDGRVDRRDAEVVKANLQIDCSPSTGDVFEPYTLSVESSQSELISGVPFDLLLNLNQEHGIPIEDIYGISFSLSIHAPSGEVDFSPNLSSSWLGEANQDLAQVWVRPGETAGESESQCIVGGITRLDGIGRDGEGLVAALRVIITIEDLEGPGESFMNLSVNHAEIVTTEGKVYVINGNNASSLEHMQIQGNTAGEAPSTPDHWFASVKAYPNPAADQLNIEWGDNPPDKLALELLDIQGKSWKKTVITDPQARGRIYWDLSSLAPGMYLLQATQEGQAFSRKILIQRP